MCKVPNLYMAVTRAMSFSYLAMSKYMIWTLHETSNNIRAKQVPPGVNVFWLHCQQRNK